VPEHLQGFDLSYWLPDVSDHEFVTSAEIHKAYQRYEAARRDWHATHEVRPLAELLADPVAMADVPWNPATDPP